MRQKLLLSLALTFAAFNAQADEFIHEGIRYTTDAIGDLMVLGPESKNEVSDVVIPSTIMVKTGDPYYPERPAEVNIIAEDAFRDCPNLQSISIPGTVSCFGNNWDANEGHPFKGSDALKLIRFEEGSGSIGLRYPFLEESHSLAALIINRNFYCQNIIDLDNGKKDVVKHPAFSGASIKHIEIAGSASELPDSAFYNAKISSLVIGENLKSLGANSFELASSLKELIIEPGSEPLDAFGKIEYRRQIDDEHMQVFTFYYKAFNDRALDDLDYLYYGREVYNCKYMDGSDREILRFDGVNNATIDVKTIPQELFVGNGSLQHVELTEKVESIGYAAFAGCEKLTEIALPSSLKEIGHSAFEACGLLTDIVLPNNLVSIGKAAFAGTTVTSIAIPNGVKEIDESTFFNCGKLTDITLNSVEKIGSMAFMNTNITSVELPESITEIGEMAFEGCPITEVRAYWETPVAAPENIFTSATYSEGKLIVPRASIESYRSEMPWSQFATIVSEPWIKSTPANLTFAPGQTVKLRFEVMDVDNPEEWVIMGVSMNPEICEYNPEMSELWTREEGIATLHVVAYCESRDEGVVKLFTVTVTNEAGLDAITADNTSDASVTVYDLQGRKHTECMRSEIVTRLPAGLYLLRTASGRTEKIAVP